MHVLPWIKAARLPSQSYIFLPLLAGQSMALHVGATLSWIGFGLAHLFGLFIQLYIVFANDCADQDTDRRNATYTPFSGGSRVLVDGDLTPQALRNAGIAMAGLSVIAGLCLTAWVGSWWTTLLAALGVMLLWMYSYPPARLSYRGGGELLQTAGVGVVLPCMGFVAQSGALSSFPWHVMAVVLPTQLACAIGTAVPDEPSDRADDKRTVPVWAGPTAARVLVVALHLLSAYALAATPLAGGHASPWWAGAVGLAAASQILFLRSRPGSGGTLAFTALSILTTLLVMVALAVVFWP